MLTKYFPILSSLSGDFLRNARISSCILEAIQAAFCVAISAYIAGVIAENTGLDSYGRIRRIEHCRTSDKSTMKKQK